MNKYSRFLYSERKIVLLHECIYYLNNKGKKQTEGIRNVSS